jgi:hypothetical protein
MSMNCLILYSLSNAYSILIQVSPLWTLCLSRPTRITRPVLFLISNLLTSLNLLIDHVTFSSIESTICGISSLLLICHILCLVSNANYITFSGLILIHILILMIHVHIMYFVSVLNVMLLFLLQLIFQLNHLSHIYTFQVSTALSHNPTNHLNFN